MNYVITGSLGHISKPIVQKLKSSGHSVTVITSNSSKVKDIEASGAVAAVGSVEDNNFLKKAFAGAQAVYLMIPPKWALSGSWLDFQKKVIQNYITTTSTPLIQSWLIHIEYLNSYSWLSIRRNTLFITLLSTDHLPHSPGKYNLRIYR